ncbi:GTPase HflX [Spirochaetia bacterium]|nr:GTPase HflX [Spirochaetia bacterium]
MHELQETEEQPKKAFLIALRQDGQKGALAAAEAELVLNELASLAGTLGLEVIGRETAVIRGRGSRSSRYGIGTGKAEELSKKAAEAGADCLVLDWDPSPSQQRNWEEISGLSALDRQELIIRIFSSRARTREAELQASLAELGYFLPRLAHKYIDLSRQRGGRYGTRGAGETRLETDRRSIEQRIQRLKAELEDVRKNRNVQRQKREKAAVPVCALVGYTNAGKSSLLNALTGADAFVEDKLFATLDATTRTITRKGRSVLLVDTVGFIRNLPHRLIDAFHSTLEETAMADLLLHVLDASDPELDRHFETTRALLEELGAEKVPVLTVLNKIDKSVDVSLADLSQRYPGSIAVSAKSGAGLEALLDRIDALLAADQRHFSFPMDRTDLAALLHRSGEVIEERYEGDRIEVIARVDSRTANMLKRWNKA